MMQESSTLTMHEGTAVQRYENKTLNNNKLTKGRMNKSCSVKVLVNSKVSACTYLKFNFNVNGPLNCCLAACALSRFR